MSKIIMTLFGLAVLWAVSPIFSGMGFGWGSLFLLVVAVAVGFLILVGADEGGFGNVAIGKNSPKMRNFREEADRDVARKMANREHSSREELMDWHNTYHKH